MRREGSTASVPASTNSRLTAASCSRDIPRIRPSSETPQRSTPPLALAKAAISSARSSGRGLVGRSPLNSICLNPQRLSSPRRKRWRISESAILTRHLRSSRVRCSRRAGPFLGKGSHVLGEQARHEAVYEVGHLLWRMALPPERVVNLPNGLGGPFRQDMPDLARLQPFRDGDFRLELVQTAASARPSRANSCVLLTQFVQFVWARNRRMWEAFNSGGFSGAGACSTRRCRCRWLTHGWRFTLRPSCSATIADAGLDHGTASFRGERSPMAGPGRAAQGERFSLSAAPVPGQPGFPPGLGVRQAAGRTRLRDRDVRTALLAAASEDLPEGACPWSGSTELPEPAPRLRPQAPPPPPPGMGPPVLGTRPGRAEIRPSVPHRPPRAGPHRWRPSPGSRARR